MTEVGIVTVHEHGQRLPTGDFSGIGGRTRYQVVLHDDDSTGRRTTPIGPKHDTPRAADGFARQVEEERSHG